ncbi:hypothetical protein AXA91_26955 [Salmonella enterica]|nr:hypothetical protein [Salmonella enterica]
MQIPDDLIPGFLVGCAMRADEAPIYNHTADVITGTYLPVSVCQNQANLIFLYSTKSRFFLIFPCKIIAVIP